MTPEEVHRRKRERQEDFLRVYRELGCVRSTLRHLAISHCALHAWRHDSDPWFKEAYAAVQQDLLDQIKTTAFTLAIRGDVKAMALVLRHLHPEFREKRDVSISGSESGPPLRVAGMTVEQAQQVLAKSVAESA